jgi:hypothetical protein
MEEKSKVYDKIFIESALKVHHIQYFAEQAKLDEDPEMENFKNGLKAVEEEKAKKWVDDNSIGETVKAEIVEACKKFDDKKEALSSPPFDFELFLELFGVVQFFAQKEI